MGEVWREGLLEQVIRNSFKVTGIYPVNKDVYPKDRLDPVKLARFNQMQSSGEVMSNPLNIFEDSPSENMERLSPSLLELETIVTPSQLVENAPPPTELLETEPPITQPQLLENVPTQLAVLESNRPITQPQLIENIPSLSAIPGPADPYKNPEPSCSFETLLLSKIKHTMPLNRKRRKIDGKGKLLTSEDYLKSIENLDKHKEKKTTKKKDELKKKETNTGI